MKPLVVCYSRTGITRKVGEDIAKILKCEYKEIKDVKSRAGPLGYLRSGREAMFKDLPPIVEPEVSLEGHDILVIGTPVWSFTMASPIRSYIIKNKKNLGEVAFFCTQGSTGAKNTFKEMETVCDKKPVAVLELLTKEVKSGDYSGKLNDFIGKINSK